MTEKMLPTFLPGRMVMGRGTSRDYGELSRFHYRGKRPASWAGVWVVRYLEEMSNFEGVMSNVVAVAVLSYPHVNSYARDRALGLSDWERGARLRFVNTHVRVISRVVVHPRFRGIGLAGDLVRAVCLESSTRYVEAFAMMGRVHPFFEKGGMRRVEERGEGVVYYLFERGKGVGF